MSWYMVKLEAVKIEESPSPLFSIIAAESGKKGNRKEKKETAERHYKRIQFWEGYFLY